MIGVGAGVLGRSPGLGMLRRERAARPLSPNQYFTDWRESKTNILPAGWSWVNDVPSDARAALVRAQLTEPAGKALVWDITGGSRNRYTLAFDALPAYAASPSQDQEVYLEIEYLAQGGGDGANEFPGGPAVRCGGSAADERVFRVTPRRILSGGARELVLNTYQGGGYTQLQTTPWDWALNTRYCFVFRAEGNRLRAKAWAKGDAEPGWMLDFLLSDVTQQSYAGPPGIHFHEPEAKRVYAWGAALRGESAPRGYATTPAAPTTRWSEDFESQAVGVFPAGFAALWQTARWRVQGGLPGASGRALEFPAGSTPQLHAIVLDAPGTVGDQEVYCEVYVPSSSLLIWSHYGGPAVRLSGPQNAATGYGIDFRTDGSTTPQFLLQRWAGANNNFGSTVASGAANLWAANGWYSVRFRADYNRLRARVWPRGTAEPPGWHIDYTDPSPILTGRPGIYYWGSQAQAPPAYYDSVHIGIDGVGAP